MASVAAFADAPSQSVLQRVANHIKSLGNYEAQFNVVAGDFQAAGSYVVSGDSYHITVGDAEVYSDGKTRYEVDNVRGEVSIDDMHLDSNNILDNPTRCFDFVGSGYTSEVQGRSGSDVTIYLHSTSEDVEGEIYLTVDEKSGRPRRIVYILYDDKIEVEILSLTSRKQPAPRFDSGKYKDYEMIDFR